MLQQDKKIKRSPSVTKHNALISACYKLTLNEKRLLFLCIAQLDPRKPLPKDNCFTVTAQEFAKTFEVAEKSVYREIESATKLLAERWIRPDEKYKHKKKQFRWVYGMEYHDQEGKVTLGFSPWVVPYLTDLSGEFTKIKLHQLAKLKSVYSIRLLEFLTQFKRTGKLFMSLEEFKGRLGLEDEYERFYNLKKRVIEVAVKELQEKTHLNISWKAIKDKKTVQRLEFYFSEKNKLP